MAPVIWGLDLAEMKWSKFKSGYMWNNRYHLRRTKFIVYQLALIFCVVSESLGTAALSDYIDQQNFVKGLDPDAEIHNNDYVGVASFNIFAGVYVAFVFGSAFFFDLFWPERKETTGVRLAWKICGVLAVIIHLAASLSMTIITALHHASITGVSDDLGIEYASKFHKDGGVPLTYKLNGRAIAAIVFDWLGWVSVVGRIMADSTDSCILLFFSINHTESGRGPFSRHVLEEEKTHSDDSPESSPISADETKDVR